MNKKSRASLIALVTIILLLVLIFPAQAAQRTDNFHVDLWEITYGDDPYTAAGSYGITYNDEDYGHGDAFVSYIPRYPGVQQGTLVLEDEDESSRMVIRFSMYFVGDGVLEWCDDLKGLGGLAQYKILFEQNRDAYDLKGEGTFELCNVAGVGEGYMDGWATEVPWPQGLGQY